MTKKAETDAKKDKQAKPPVPKPRVKDLDSPEEHAKGVRGGNVKDSHDRYA